MRAVLLTRHGSPTVLQLSDGPVPAPSAGQVPGKIRTIGINYAGVLSRKGLYGWAPTRPCVLGMEACGKFVVKGGLT